MQIRIPPDGVRFADTLHVRATEMMNSKSSNDFRWSVRLADIKWVCFGIASNELVQNELPETINTNDKNAIVYYPYSGSIRKGQILVQTLPTTNVTPGDEIHFRFQPKMKKFLISFVSQLF